MVKYLTSWLVSEHVGLLNILIISQSNCCNGVAEDLVHTSVEINSQSYSKVIQAAMYSFGIPSPICDELVKYDRSLSLLFIN